MSVIKNKYERVHLLLNRGSIASNIINIYTVQILKPIYLIETTSALNRKIKNFTITMAITPTTETNITVFWWIIYIPEETAIGNMKFFINNFQTNGLEKFMKEGSIILSHGVANSIQPCQIKTNLSKIIRKDENIFLIYTSPSIGGYNLTASIDYSICYV